MRTHDAGAKLAKILVDVGARMGLAVSPHLSDGSQPIGRGNGPALEARDVLSVLKNEPDAPSDLRQKGIELAAQVISLVRAGDEVNALGQATSLLETGAALARFVEICEAQGGFREAPVAALQRAVRAPQSGRVTSIDSRLIARAAKLAGAPEAAAAGLVMHVRLGDTFLEGDPMFTLHAETTGELDYASAFVTKNPHLFGISAQ